MALIKRLDIGRPITAAEMDANLQYLEDSINVGTSGTSGVSGTSGTRGTSGSSGLSGSSGSSGTRGTSGSSGISGSSGTSGVSGSSGTSGVSGSSGTSGAGTSGTSGTSLALSLFDGGANRLSGIQNITLSGLSLAASGSGGATITNLGGGGGGSTINVQSGSTTVSSVSTLRVDASTMSLTNNGAGTVTIGVVGGGVSGTNGSAGTSGTSISLTLRKGISVISGVQSITLTGSIFLDNSGSNGAFLRVDDTGGPALIGVITSSQQIVNYDVFAVKSSSNSFLGTQNITGSLISTELYVENSPNFRIPQGNIMVGASGSRSAFLPTSSLGFSGVSVIDQGMNITFTEKTKLAFTDDFVVSASGSDGVVISSVGGGGGSGAGFPFTGSAGISGSLSVTGNVSVGGFLTASAFAISSVGTPTIESATNINLTAGNAVVVSSSPLRLAIFTDAQTGSLTPQNGDMIYNSTTHKFMGYASGSWVQLH